MVKVEVEYQGGLRCSAVHGPSSVRMLTDAPVDNHGQGASFSPTDLVATALGTCMLTTMGIVAEREGWNLRGARVSVEKGMVQAPLRRVGRLAVTIRVPGEFDAKARALLEKTALTCPVQQSLSPAIEVPVQFEWGALPVRA
jgi:putative redox protein